MLCFAGTFLLTNPWLKNSCRDQQPAPGFSADIRLTSTRRPSINQTFHVANEVAGTRYPLAAAICIPGAFLAANNNIPAISLLI